MARERPSRSLPTAWSQRFSACTFYFLVWDSSRFPQKDFVSWKVGECLCFLRSGALFLPTVASYYCECCADTWGSEVGIISSTPYLLLMPWKPVPAGTNGGISILGLFAAILAGISMTILYYFLQLPPSMVVFSLNRSD